MKKKTPLNLAESDSPSRDSQKSTRSPPQGSRNLPAGRTKALAAHLNSKRCELAPFRPPLTEEAERERRPRSFWKVARKVAGWPWTWGWSRGKEGSWDGERAPHTQTYPLVAAWGSGRWAVNKSRGEALAGKSQCRPGLDGASNLRNPVRNTMNDSWKKLEACEGKKGGDQGQKSWQGQESFYVRTQNL